MPRNKYIYPSPKQTSGPSFYPRKSSIHPKAVSWEHVFTLITQDLQIEECTADARKYREMGDEQAYTDAKGRLGAITPAAQFSGGHKIDNLVALTGVSMVDFDHVDLSKLADALRTIRSSRHTFLCHVTTSGTGIRVLFRYACSEPEMAYRDAWELGNQYYAMLTGLEPDKAVSDVTRLSFLTHDANAYYNPDAVPFIVSTAESSPFADTAANRPQDDPVALAEHILEKQGVTFVEGGRHFYLMQIARLLLKMGIPEAETAAYAESRMSDDPTDARNVVSWVYGHFAQSFGTWQRSDVKSQKSNRSDVQRLTSNVMDNEEAQDVRPQTDDVRRKTQDVRQKSATPAEIRAFLLDHGLLRYNTLAAVTEVWNEESKAFEQATDRAVNTLWDTCNKQLGKYVKPVDFDRELNSDAVPLFNPVEEYFKALPAWDGTDHIAALAARVHTTAHPQLFEKCLRKWLVAMVESWRNPKVLNQNILIFIGLQGIFKSTFFRNLLPPELSRYFLAKGNSTYVSKDDKIAVSSYLLIDFEEVDSMRDADLNAVKALVTTEVVAERAAYARNREARVHISSFCGTGNNRQFLTDMTGNRRWLPFEVTAIDDPYTHPVPYDQLYAQCLHLISEGYQYYFTHDEDEAMEAYKNTFTEPCAEEEQLRRYYRRPNPGEAGVLLSTTDIVARCSADLRTQFSIKKMGMALKRAGYQQHATNGRRGYILIERTFDEIQHLRIEEATEALRAEKAARETQQLKLDEEQ